MQILQNGKKWIPASGPVAKDEIASSLAPKWQAPRNDRKR